VNIASIAINSDDYQKYTGVDLPSLVKPTVTRSQRADASGWFEHSVTVFLASGAGAKGFVRLTAAA
jgi:hypothetical protein